jgi:hypothetical protein
LKVHEEFAVGNLQLGLVKIKKNESAWGQNVVIETVTRGEVICLIAKSIRFEVRM